MPTINPYINFNGNAEEAFTFYKSVFGGEFGKITRFKDIAGPHSHVGEHEAEKILRITLPIGNTMLIANDVPEAMGRVNEQERMCVQSVIKLPQTSARRRSTAHSSPTGFPSGTRSSRAGTRTTSTSGTCACRGAWRCAGPRRVRHRGAGGVTARL